VFGSAESEHPRLTNGEIIFEEFQPMWSQFTNDTIRYDTIGEINVDSKAEYTASETDGQTTGDRKTALCTLVQSAVINHV